MAGKEKPNPTHREIADSFFAGEDRLLADISGGLPFSFRPGEQWAIDPETGDATYDTKFFTDQGYTPSQALFGALHEIRCHLVELADLLATPEGKTEYEKLKKRQKKQRVRIWENCREDAKGNLAIIKLAPSLGDDVAKLYREKLWPETDLTKSPRHLQFMYAILRQAMLPDEDVKVDPKVAEEIKKLRSIKGKNGKSYDAIAMVTNPSADPLLALKFSQRFIEPVIDKLFDGDVKEKKKQHAKGNAGNSETYFADDYADYDKRHPEPFDEDEMEEKIEETKANQSTSSRQNAAYEQEHGVTLAQIAEYNKVYKEIEPYIEPLRQIFRRVIGQRQTTIRHLVKNKKNGIMLDPGRMVQTYLDVQAGVSDPKTTMDFEGKLIDESIPTDFEVTIACDKTGSMQEGAKIPEQRKGTVLLLEALREFSDTAEELGPLVPTLGVRSEVWSFGDEPNHTEALKHLSHDLTEKERIRVFKALGDCDSEVNNEEVMFTKIYESILEEAKRDPTYLDKIKNGKLRKFVIILTDGQTYRLGEVRRQIQKLRSLGVVVAGVGITDDGASAVRTYAPDGRVARNASDLPQVLQTLLAQYLDTLLIKDEENT